MERLTDREARDRFGELYAATYRDVAAYARRRTASVEDADDVVADTFLVAWRRLGEALAADSPQAWLYGVAYRCLANRRRSRRRLAALVDRLAVTDPPSDSPAPARQVEAADDLTRVEAAMRTLPPRYREVLQLTAWEGLTPAEIGVALGVGARKVSSMLYRARAALRKAVAAQAGKGDRP